MPSSPLLLQPRRRAALSLLKAAACISMLVTPVAMAKAAGSKAAPIDAWDAEAFSAATETPSIGQGSSGKAVVRAQILLDRLWYSPGEIDGRYGLNMQRVVRAFQSDAGVPRTGRVDKATWAALRGAGSGASASASAASAADAGSTGVQLLTTYKITDKDMGGPFQKTPTPMAERAKLDALPYASVEEMLGERFHISPALMAQMNPSQKLTAGSSIIVPNVADTKPPARARSIEIDKASKVLYLMSADGRTPVAAFPISIGNEKNDPLPIGEMKIRNEVSMPDFTYDPSLLKSVSSKDVEKLRIPPGPNNPVGSIWMGLSKPHWGIHGTPEPSKVGHSETNGCIHLTNWDAERVSKLARAGFVVQVKP
ncbi:MAG: L,D-transpeptidase family protein [Rubrivivax sp.]